MIKLALMNGSIVRRGSIDTGAGMSAISAGAFHRDGQSLGGRVVELIHPLHIKMYNGNVVHATSMVKGARIGIGCAEYEIDLIVVPGAGYDYLLGADFMAEYDASPRLRLGRFYLGVEGRVNPQWVPLSFKGVVHRWAIKGDGGQPRGACIPPPPPPPFRSKHHG